MQNHGHKMAADATVFRDTFISMIPAGVRVMARYIREFRSVFLRRHTGGALHPHNALPRQRFVRYSGTCTCDVTYSTPWRAPIARSYCASLALCVMLRKRGEDNGMHACKHGNIMTPAGGGVNND